MPMTRLTTTSAPVQIGSASRVSAPVAPRITSDRPQTTMPRSFGPKYMKKGGKISTAETKNSKCSGW